MGYFSEKSEINYCGTETTAGAGAHCFDVDLKINFYQQAGSCQDPTSTESILLISCQTVTN